MLEPILEENINFNITCNIHVLDFPGLSIVRLVIRAPGDDIIHG